jgi:hypothetical protein
MQCVVRKDQAATENNDTLATDGDGSRSSSNSASGKR